MSFAKKVVVITGASKGLGLGMARQFLQQGLRLGLCARSKIPDLGHADHVETAQVDVGKWSEVSQFCEQVIRRFGHIDLWINNAGIIDPISNLRDIEPSSFSKAWEVNVLGCLHGSQAFVRDLRSRGTSGVLVNISSGAARQGLPGWTAYCCTKAAVERMTECVAREESDQGLRCYSLSPGLIDTQMQATIREASPEDFPLVEKFKEHKRNENFYTPAFVADEILKLAFHDDPRRKDVIIKL